MLNATGKRAKTVNWGAIGTLGFGVSSAISSEHNAFVNYRKNSTFQIFMPQDSNKLVTEVAPMEVAKIDVGNKFDEKRYTIIYKNWFRFTNNYRK